MKYSLVGYTGFVGGNLAEQHSFDNLYNSKNIKESFGADNGFVVYSGMPAEKFTANAHPEEDFARAQNAMENIRKMRPEKLVLISTVDVYPRPRGVYEDTALNGENTPAYGKNRLELEGWVRQEFPEALIVRLPGLFGKGLKKNFIFDMFTVTPSALTEAKYSELAEKNTLVAESYKQDESGFYRLLPLYADKAEQLRSFYENNDFNALSFTDSRSVYQFYSLANLWADINTSLKKNLRLVNLATQPVEAGALYHMLFGKEFVNHLGKEPVWYDMRTRYGRDFGGDDDYILDRAGVVADIARFARDEFKLF